jgi:large subunit ribosomal protein L18e
MRPVVRKENAELARVLQLLRRAARSHDAPIWGAVADRLTRPRHRVDPLNVGHLDRLAAVQETVVVPGKVLAAGRLTKPVTVAAWGFSAEARSKIVAAGGRPMGIEEILRRHPEGKGVRILG